MTKPNLKAGALVVAGLMTVGATQTRAATIVVQNYSFETESGPGTNQPADFTLAGGVGRSLTQPSISNYGVVTNSGNYYIELNNNYGGNSSVSQTTSATVIAGETFTLSVEIGEVDSTGGYTGGELTANDYVGSLELVIGSNDITNTLTNTETPTSGTFGSTESLTYTATAADVGKSIGVELYNPNDAGSKNSLGNGDTVLFFDDLHLSVEPAASPSVPEPSTWAMMLAGLLSLVGFRRFTRNANETR